MKNRIKDFLKSNFKYIIFGFLFIFLIIIEIFQNIKINNLNKKISFQQQQIARKINRNNKSNKTFKKEKADYIVNNENNNKPSFKDKKDIHFKKHKKNNENSINEINLVDNKNNINTDKYLVIDFDNPPYFDDFFMDFDRTIREDFERMKKY